MKKLFAVLLAVLMLASISVCAFAADSPTQVIEPAPTVDDAGPAAPVEDEEEEEDEDDLTPEEIDDAEDAEEEAAKAVTESEAAAEDGDALIVCLGALTDEATPAMEEDHADLIDELVAAKKDLAEDEAAAIPDDLEADAPEGATVTASQPFRAVASEYPATITIAVENPDDFVGMMVFVNGKWVKLNCVNNGDGTVTFVLDQPAVLSVVTAIVEAA